MGVKESILYGVSLSGACVIYLLPLRHRENFLIRLILLGVGTAHITHYTTHSKGPPFCIKI